MEEEEEEVIGRRDEEEEEEEEEGRGRGEGGYAVEGDEGEKVEEEDEVKASREKSVERSSRGIRNTHRLQESYSLSLHFIGFHRHNHRSDDFYYHHLYTYMDGVKSKINY